MKSGGNNLWTICYLSLGILNFKRHKVLRHLLQSNANKYRVKLRLFFQLLCSGQKKLKLSNCQSKLKGLLSNMFNFSVACLCISNSRQETNGANLLTSTVTVNPILMVQCSMEILENCSFAKKSKPDACCECYFLALQE